MASENTQQFRTLYLDCFAGLSGNMMIGALLDLAEQMDISIYQDVIAVVQSMGFSESLLIKKETQKCGIRACYFNVQEEDGHPHRHLSDVLEIINSSSVNLKVQKRASKCFRILAEAEAYIHGCSIEEIHFHEVGAIDAIIDIVTSCYLLDTLQIKHVFSSKVRSGYGFVDCAHGKMPIPAPATAKMLESIPYYLGDSKGEFITPTGAALLLGFDSNFDVRPNIIWSSIGHGAGSRDAEFPNILRVFCGETPTSGKETKEKENFSKLQSHHLEVKQRQSMQNICKNLSEKNPSLQLVVEEVIILESYIDDMTAEALSFLQKQCMDAGALDFYATATIGKKSRLGQKIEILVEFQLEQRVLEILLQFSETLGIRRNSEYRYVRNRRMETVDTQFGKISGKVVGNRFLPEFEDCAKSAKEHKISLCEINAVAKVCFQAK